MAGHHKIRNKKVAARKRRQAHIRKRVLGTAERPRLSVFRSLSHIYAQAIDDVSQKVLAAASDVGKKAKASGKKKERARAVGKDIGAKLKALKIKGVVFDRNGFIYHGRVKEVAEGAREAGLEF
jgi:large subunit ribosomal protein L18